MAQTQKSKGKAAQYASYKANSRYSANKRKKLQRHLKKYPTDLVAAKALESIALYRRKAPKTAAWLKSDKAITALFHSGGDKRDYRPLRIEQMEELNSHKNELSDKARAQLAAQAAKPKREVKSDFFKLGARIKDL